MAVIIGSARIDERGKARGGKAGDQTGKEVSTQDWYKHSKGWVLLRPKAASVAEKIACAMQSACDNGKIGYDQWQRDSLYNQVKSKGFDPAAATTACETDCSALVRVCVAFALGRAIGNFRTTTEASVLMETGEFDKLTSDKYTKYQDYLKRGDILVTKTQGHTVVVLSDGSKAGADAPASTDACQYSEPTVLVKRGATGNAVKWVQWHLLKWSGSCLPQYGADGDYGAETQKAVCSFQADKALEVDGIVGKITRAALKACVMVDGGGDDGGEDSEDEKTYPIHNSCPDVSANQVDIDFDAFCAGNDFVILRARGSGKEDSKFAKWAAEFRRRGFPICVYDFVKLTSVADAVKQADAMFAACSVYNPRIYYLDTEKRALGVSYAKERAYLKAYVDRLRALGVQRVGQYTGDYRWRSQYHKIEDYFDTLWIANWGKNTGYVTSYPKAKSDKIHLHQYTSNGYTKIKGEWTPGAPGIKHRVDLNRITGLVPLSWFTGRKHSGVDEAVKKG